MRSSKSRSRSKNNNNNRNRSVGNIINRVFDSSGPEGKVRGTPQQIIEKYSQLARDAFLGNDRVAAENFQQHSEHYARMLAEAMAEMEAQRREQYERDGRNNPQGQSRDDSQRDGDDGRSAQETASRDYRHQPQVDLGNPSAGQLRAEAEPADPATGEDILVETPEARSAEAEPAPSGSGSSSARRAPRPRKPRSGGTVTEAPEAAE